MSAAAVLLVEDNQDDVDVTLLAFRRAGLTNVSVARDGVEALSYLQSQAATMPRVAFVDLSMPRMNGIELLKALRRDERTALLPVVMLTSSTLPTDLEAAYRAGANSYVRKAIDATAFDRIAEQLAKYWVSVNETP